MGFTSMLFSCTLAVPNASPALFSRMSTCTQQAMSQRLTAPVCSGQY